MNKLQIGLIAVFFMMSACGGEENAKSGNGVGESLDNGSTASNQLNTDGRDIGKANEFEEKPEDAEPQPKDIHAFFMKLPNEYFVIESCADLKKTSLCEKEKIGYLKDFTTVEDRKNGYLEAGGDGAQSAMKMAIFRRQDGSYLVGLNVFGEAQDSYKFLEFTEGKWRDISLEVIPEYSSTNIYELPRNGTTIQVFAKKIIEQGKDFEVSEKGEKLYDLKWADGEFSIQK